MLYLNIVGIYRMHIKDINIKNSYYSNNFIKARKLETKNILIDKKNYNFLVIYFTRCVHSNCIIMNQWERFKNMKKMFLMTDNNMVEKVFDNTKMLIVIDNKLPDDVALKNVVILMTCVIKENDKFYTKIFKKHY